MFFYPYQRPHRYQTKEDKLAPKICLGITAAVLILLGVGFWLKNPYLLAAAILIPAGYEAWRTEGCQTKWLSIVILVLVIVEILALAGVIKLNLAKMLDLSTAYWRGQLYPLGDIKFVIPALIVIMAFPLFRYTYGPYTKWLSILILISGLALLYVANPDFFAFILRNYLSNPYYY